jgi:hypothetical protein
MKRTAVPRLRRATPERDGFTAARRPHIRPLTARTDPARRRPVAAVGRELFLPQPVEPAAVWQPGRGPVNPPRTGWITGLTYAETEDLLDWLEANGYPPAELSVPDEAGFAVRWPGFGEVG